LDDKSKPRIVTTPTVGVSQWAIHSPLLANIFLTPLDHLVESIILRENRGKRGGQKDNPVYAKIMKAKRTAFIKKKKGLLTPELRLQLSRQARLVPTSIPSPRFIRINYVRYADDFVISVIGPHSLATRILKEVTDFVTSLGLNLNESKTGITSFTKGFKFLGALISSRAHHIKPLKLVTKGPHAGKKVRITPYINIHAPIRELQARLVTRGYAK
jgi:retron-type reverse transcriptase